MIFDAILNFILFIPNLLLDSLNFMGNISIPPDVVEWWSNTLGILTYVFPVTAILPILLISFNIKMFQIAWSVISWLSLH